MNGYLNDQNIQITGNSSYSPDLAPNDFLFPRVKDTLGGLHLVSAEKAVDKNDLKMKS